jgi:hypothetical protein
MNTENPIKDVTNLLIRIDEQLYIKKEHAKPGEHVSFINIVKFKPGTFEKDRRDAYTINVDHIHGLEDLLLLDVI